MKWPQIFYIAIICFATLKHVYQLGQKKITLMQFIGVLVTDIMVFAILITGGFFK
jgi:hypothetical protein